MCEWDHAIYLYGPSDSVLLTMPAHAPITLPTSTLPDSRSQDFRAFILHVQCTQFLLSIHSALSGLVPGSQNFLECKRFGKTFASGRVCVQRHCAVGLCAVSSKPAPSSSRGTSLHTSPRKPSGHCCLCSLARVWMSVRPPKGVFGTMQSRAFAPEATLCVKNVRQSKVRWIRAVLASRTELVCAPNATAVVPDCDTGHEGEFLIYANYGE